MVPQELVREIDEDGDGEIDFDEFCAMIKKKMAGGSVEETHEAFKAFNKSGNGFLSAEEIRSVLEKMGEQVTDAEVAQLVKEIVSAASHATCLPSPPRTKQGLA